MLRQKDEWGRLRLAAQISLLLVALASLVAFGIFGVGRDGSLNFDGRVLYAAGRAWLTGLNPYDHGEIVRGVSGVPGMDLSQAQFLYPPQSGAFCVLLGLFPYAGARVVWLLFNLGAVAAIVAGTVTLVRDRDFARDDHDRWAPFVMATVVIASPFTAHVVWMGQTTLIAFAATLGAWMFARNGRWALAGVWLGVATFKPQVSILVVMWFVLKRDWKVLGTALLTLLALALYPMVTRGPVRAFLEWRDGLRSGYYVVFNVPGAAHKVGLESLLAAAGVELPAWASTVLAAGCALALWLLRDRIAWEDLLGLLMAATLTFSRQIHDYDYVCLAPTLASLWWWGRRRGPLASLVLALPVLLFVPQRLLRRFEAPVLLQWRTIVIVAVAVAVVALGRGLPRPVAPPAPSER
jgi:hypothetical protein